MKVVFAGTPDFASTALSALVAAGHEVVLVLAQPDRPAGRGMRVEAGPVKSVALRHGIPALQPHGLRIGGRYDADARAARGRLVSTPHDVMVVAAYGLILPQDVLDIPPLGCMNIHASLLPRWRGAAPVQRAIEAGDVETGVTIMQMDAGLDTGAALLMRPVPIEPSDTGGSLTTRLARVGGEAIVDALRARAAGPIAAIPQSALGGEAAATYASKITKLEAAIDFASPTLAIVDRIRAFDPWPGCTADLVGSHEADAGAVRYKIWKAHAVAAVTVATTFDKGHPVGSARVARGGGTGGDAVLVRTGDGAVALTELQKPGGKRLAATHFLRDVEAVRDARFVVA